MINLIELIKHNEKKSEKMNQEMCIQFYEPNETKMKMKVKILKGKPKKGKNQEYLDWPVLTLIEKFKQDCFFQTNKGKLLKQSQV